jgi:hypothetical protein
MTTIFRETTVRTLSVVSFFAAILLSGTALTASAQDAMQLDTAFRDSLLRKPASDGHAAYQEDQGQQRAQPIGSRPSRIRRSRVR